MVFRGKLVFPVCSEACLIEYIKKLPDVYPRIEPVVSSLDFKSSIEKLCFQKLSRHFNVVYEPFRVLLSKRTVYVPDFYIPEKNLFIEVKGAKMTRLWKVKLFGQKFSIFMLTTKCIETFGWR